MHLPKPYLGMGTWGMGGTYERDPNNSDASVEALRVGLSLGLKIIDVAELYGAGLSEEIVGRAIKGQRGDVYVMSKVWKTNLHYDDVLRAAEGSLKRLDTDHIDLYLVHWPNHEIPLSETMRAMERLADDKIISAIGVSNFPSQLMEEAQSYLTHTKIIANEFEYNLLTREAENDIIPYCRAHDIDIIAYRPLAKGALAKQTHTILADLAKKYAKTPNQIALNWILSQDMVAIPKSGNPLHIKENAGCLGWELAKEDIERLRHA
ncbi:MAG TPA: aldo/keto reductase [Candidatus Paceibacterota bacterium]|nr:aldo/keto reductase [Candidatus Paceibacterota bacterium]